MILKIVDNIDTSQYEKFLNCNTHSTFYHSKKHLVFLEKILACKSKFIIMKDKNEIKGVLPFFLKKTKYGNVVNSLPFFGSYGGLIAKDDKIIKQLLEKLNKFNEDNKVISSVIISNPFDSKKRVYEDFFIFNTKQERIIQCLKLENKSEEEIWDGFEQRVRRSIRKGLKNKIEVKTEILDKYTLKCFYKMHKKNMMDRGGSVKPYSFFENLNNSFSQGKDFDIFIALHENRIIAFLLVFYFDSFVEYYMPAYDDNYSNLQGTSLLIWESIKTALRKKIKMYNFGGTGKNQTSLYKFKRGWNSQDFFYNYYIFRDLERLQKIGMNKIKNHFENFFVCDYAEINITS